MANTFYTTQKKSRITYYIIFVLAILNLCSYFERAGTCIQLSKHYQWACNSTSINFQDDLTVIFENRERIFNDKAFFFPTA